MKGENAGVVLSFDSESNQWKLEKYMIRFSGWFAKSSCLQWKKTHKGSNLRWTSLNKKVLGRCMQQWWLFLQVA